MKSYIFITSFVTSVAVVAACSQNTFSSDGKGNANNSDQNPKPGQPGDAVPGAGGPGGSPLPIPTLSSSQGIIPLNENVKCSEGLVQIISSGAATPQSCPANSTAFAADDGSTVLYACCALPKTDILLQTVPTAVRGNQCQEDELIVGLAGSSVVCQKIDTTKYRLTNPRSACYYGKGSSGSSGAGPCGAPNKFLNAIGSRFGSDGCVAPQGSIVHGHKGTDCGDIPIRTLQAIDGSAVAFPY